MLGPGRNDPCPAARDVRSSAAADSSAARPRSSSLARMSRRWCVTPSATSPSYPATRSTISGMGSSLSPRPT
jgi:hypothetical protein